MCRTLVEILQTFLWECCLELCKLSLSWLGHLCPFFHQQRHLRIWIASYNVSFYYTHYLQKYGFPIHNRLTIGIKIFIIVDWSYFLCHTTLIEMTYISSWRTSTHPWKRKHLYTQNNCTSTHVYTILRQFKLHAYCSQMITLILQTSYAIATSRL